MNDFFLFFFIVGTKVGRFVLPYEDVQTSISVLSSGKKRFSGKNKCLKMQL